MDYKDAVTTAAMLIETPGENPEYERGCINLLADMFGVPGMDVGERMEQVAADIDAICKGETPNVIERIENMLHALDEASERNVNDAVEGVIDYVRGVCGEILTMIDGR